MRGRLRRYLPFLGWILGVSLIPPTVFLSISYYEYVNSARTSLKVAVEEGVRRIDTVLRTGNEILLDVSNTIDPNDPEAEERLERIIYDNPLFRETGIVDEQGFLVLTNLGDVTPPELIDPEYRSDARIPALQIVGRERTIVMGEESIILSLPTEVQGEVNALINPVILTAPWGASQSCALSTDGFLAYINTRNGQVLAGQGNLPTLDTISLDQKAHRIQVSQTSQNGEVLVIAEVSKDWVLARWQRLLFLGCPVAALCSGIIFVLTTRMVKQSEGLDRELSIGLEQQELMVHYQPILDLQTEDCIGSEALLRWYHPEQGILPPSLFIPIAEKTGLINKIGAWVIQQVTHEQAPLYQKFSGLYTSINLSPAQLNSGNIDAVITWLQSLQLSDACTPHRFVFEVTETAAAIRPGTTTTDILARLRALGSRVALDDFGQGYSSLSYLHQLNIDILKIDQFYVAAIDKDPQIVTILESIIELGSKLQLTMVAEGIETEGQRLFLLNHGVKYGQGWLFSRPLPIQEFERFLNRKMLP